eukprot:gene3213-4025_t
MSLDIAKGMEFLHSHKIIHRDLKPNNLLIGENWNIKICDFGFSKILINPMTTSICGTDEYMSPEVILGMEYSYSADVFSFGMVLIEMITRNKLEERLPQNSFEIDLDTLLPTIPTDCPNEFLQLALKCCQYYPEQRPTFQQIVKHLEELFNQLSPSQSPIHQHINQHNCTDNNIILPLSPNFSDFSTSPSSISSRSSILSTSPFPPTPFLISNPVFEETSLLLDQSWCLLPKSPSSCKNSMDSIEIPATTTSTTTNKTSHIIKQLNELDFEDENSFDEEDDIITGLSSSTISTSRKDSNSSFDKKMIQNINSSSSIIVDDYITNTTTNNNINSEVKSYWVKSLCNIC